MYCYYYYFFIPSLVKILRVKSYRLKSKSGVLEVWCFVGAGEYLTDQNGIEPLYENRNALPKKRCFSGIS